MGIESSETAKRAYKLLLQIPKGRITTYAALAKAVGRPKAARLMGAIMRANPTTGPCYKVVKSDGSIGGYSGSDPKNIESKIRKLAADGIIVKDGKVQDFEKVFFDKFKRR